MNEYTCTYMVMIIIICKHFGIILILKVKATGFSPKSTINIILVIHHYIYDIIL